VISSWSGYYHSRQINISCHYQQDICRQCDAIQININTYNKLDGWPSSCPWQLRCCGWRHLRGKHRCSFHERRARWPHNRSVELSRRYLGRLVTVSYPDTVPRHYWLTPHTEAQILSQDKCADLLQQWSMCRTCDREAQSSSDWHISDITTLSIYSYLLLVTLRPHYHLHHHHHHRSWHAPLDLSVFRHIVL